VELNNESLLFASGYQKIFVLLVFALLIIAEKHSGQRANDTGIVNRSRRLNVQMFLFNDVTMNLLSVSSLLMIAENFSGFGLFNLIQSIPIKMFLSFTLFDLMLYWMHRARHQVKFLWMFHKVHHSDIDLNTTTALRLHIVEVFLTTVGKALFIVIMGVPTLLVAFNEIIITAIVMMNHANITFRGEKKLAYIFIVPCKHLVHHSKQWREHESNFGFALSVWDRAFGTYLKSEPDAIGLPQIREPSFLEALLLKWKRTSR
jgi:sterol desaturase/sphingolipid hydroxylase (fatty acid hydroxylase superfamily)